MSARCEPPEELRGVDGWHWLELHGMTEPAPYRWQHEGIWCGLERHGSAVRPAWAGKIGYRYLAPVATPATVRALVDALERIADDITVIEDAANPDNWPANVARAALARAALTQEPGNEG